jgi:prophage regulatory protein
VKAKYETTTAAAAILAAGNVNVSVPEQQTPLVHPEVPESERTKWLSCRSQQSSIDHRPRKLGETREATGPSAASAGLRFLNYDDLKHLKGITYCRVHLQRLENEGRFPQRVQIGAGRIGWLESEIDEWIETRAAARPPRRAPATQRGPQRRDEAMEEFSR